MSNESTNTIYRSWNYANVYAYQLRVTRPARESIKIEKPNTNTNQETK